MNESLPKLHLGCGTNAVDGWINIDASFTARLSKIPWLYEFLCKVAGVQLVYWPKSVRVIDVRKGLPFPDNSIGIIFTSHMLEHMTYADANKLLRECYRCLSPDGVFRVIVPDLFRIATNYISAVKSAQSPENSLDFLRALNLTPNWPSGIKGYFYGKLGLSLHQHMYDECVLRESFASAGFVEIKRAVFGVSEFQNIKEIETEDRHTDSLCMEAMKRR